MRKEGKTKLTFKTNYDKTSKMCEWLHKDSGARYRSDVLWNGLLHDHVWYDDRGPRMTRKLAKLTEGMYA